MEFGSYKRAYRYPDDASYLSFESKSGEWITPTYVKSTKPKKVWKPSWNNLKSRGIIKIQQELLREGENIFKKKLV